MKHIVKKILFDLEYLLVHLYLFLINLPPKHYSNTIVIMKY